MADERIAFLLRQAGRLGAKEPGTNERLLERFVAERDEEAFAELVHRHGPMVLNVCRRLLGHQQDAEDAFQATFLTMARSASSIRKRQSLASWLHGVAHRVARTVRRTRARRQRHEGGLRSMTTHCPATELDWREVQTILETEIARLPEQLRTVFVLCCLEGRHRTEVARELGIKDGTVSSRLDRARKRLQARLLQRGISLAAALGAAALTPESIQAAVSPFLMSQTVRASVAYAADPGALSSVSDEVAAIVLAGNPSAEARRRAETLLEKLGGPVTNLEQLRTLRAIEVLERIGTRESTQVIEKLARGAVEAGESQEARRSLERLSRRR